MNRITRAWLEARIDQCEQAAAVAKYPEPILERLRYYREELEKLELNPDAWP